MLVSIGEAFMLFTIGLKVVIKVSDVRHDCWCEALKALIL